MSIFSKRKLGLLVAAATLSAGSFSAPVYAEEDEAIEEVVVTGSRIPRTGFVSWHHDKDTTANAIP